MSAIVETSFFFAPQNVGFFNSKLGQAADTNQTIDCGLSAKLAIFLHLNFCQDSIVLYVLTFLTNFIAVAQCYPIWQN